MRPSDDQVAECVAISHDSRNFLINLLIGALISHFDLEKVNLIVDVPNEPWDITKKINVINWLLCIEYVVSPEKRISERQ